MQNQGQQFGTPMSPMGNGAGVGVPMNGGGGMPGMQGGAPVVPSGIVPRPINNMASNVAAKIEQSSNILVALSKDPSVDEISAALGLTMLLDGMGKHVTAIYSGRTPNAIRFLKPEKTFETNANSLQDFIIALNKDKADHLRYKVDGDFVKVYITPYKTTITERDLEFSHGDFNVDLVVSLGVETEGELDAALAEHGRIMHDAGSINITIEPSGKFAEMEWSEPGASSVCEMVAKLTEQFRNRPALTQEMATALLTGIVSNTDRFMNEKTTPEVMGVASKLMQAGANQMLISMNISKDKGPMKMGVQSEEKSEDEKKGEPETDAENEQKIEEELAKPLKHKDEKEIPAEKSDEKKPEEKTEGESEEKSEEERSKEAKELDDLAASVVAAAEESAEKMPGKVPDSSPRLEIEGEKEKPEEKSEEEPSEEKEEADDEEDSKPKELLDEQSFEDKIMTEREAVNRFGEGLPNAPKEHKIPGSSNVNESDDSEKKEDARLLTREKFDEDEEEKPEDSGKTEEKKEKDLSAEEELDKMVSQNMGVGGQSSGGVMNELKMMGAMPADQMKNMMGEMPMPLKGSTRLDTTGAANVRDLAKLKKGVVLTEEMDAEDVLGEESAAASEKVLNSDIYPEIHDLPENPEIKPTRPKDYGAMMDLALAEPLPGMTNSNSSQSPIAQAPVAQGPNLQGLQNLLNPAAQMAPQVANQPEANHIPTMEYIPDTPTGVENPAQMNGQYLAAPQQMPNPQMMAQPMQSPQMPGMQQPMMSQPLTPQQLAMQVMSQMSPTQQGAQQAQPVMTPAPQGSGMNGNLPMPDINFPAPPAPPVDFSQMMPPMMDGSMPMQQPMMQPQMPMQEMPQQSMQQPIMQQPAQQMPQMQQPAQNSMTAGQLVQQNDPSAFRIPGM